jgi:hypothetical protein
MFSQCVYWASQAGLSGPAELELEQAEHAPAQGCEHARQPRGGLVVRCPELCEHPARLF